MTLQDAFTAWLDASKQLEVWKETEARLREQLVEGYFPNADPEGTTKLPLNDGWEMHCTMRMNRKVLNRNGEATKVYQQLPPEVADEVIAWKPDLKLRGYRKLSDEQRALVDTVVESKPGLPSLKLVPPKEEK